MRKFQWNLEIISDTLGHEGGKDLEEERVDNAFEIVPLL